MERLWDSLRVPERNESEARPQVSSWPIVLLWYELHLGCAADFWAEGEKTGFRKGGPELAAPSPCCPKTPSLSPNGNGTSSTGGHHGTRLWEWSSIYQGQVSAALWSVFQSYIVSTHPEKERKVSFPMPVNLPGGDCVDLAWFTTKVYVSLFSTLPGLPSTFLGCGLELMFIYLVCLAYHILHLSSTSTWFCALQKAAQC